MEDRRQHIRFFDYLLDRPLPVAGTLAVLVAAFRSSSNSRYIMEIALGF